MEMKNDILEATDEEKIFLFKMAAEFTNSTIKDELDNTYKPCFKTIFESRLDTVAYIYFNFKKKYSVNTFNLL